MKSFSFKMTPDEYYIGWNEKNKMINGNKNLIMTIFCIVLIAVLVVVNIFVFKMFIAYLLVLMVAFIPIIKINSEKRAIKNNFLQCPFLNGETTVFVKENGVEFNNGFEKIYCDFDCIYYAKNEDKHLIICPTLKKGTFVINKERYKSEELDELLQILKEKNVLKENKK